MMVTEHWHDAFNPKKFLSKVNIDKFIAHNETYNENQVGSTNTQCILCQSTESPGLLLNDKSYLCKSCFEETARISYPEKYEGQRRKYLLEREARNVAKAAFVKSCPYKKTAGFAFGAAFLSLLLLFIHLGFIAITGILFYVSSVLEAKHRKRLEEWNTTYPEPREPTLRHFHDPLAELSSRDHKILKIFNNWPGYPPFWNYLREVVLGRDSSRCQVSGCPSRVSLHIHHKLPVSKGGEHVPNNLITLCDFHHALEPDEGHERIWGKIKTRYFTMVRDHTRRNRSGAGSHPVCAHVRRLELVSEDEITQIKQYYALSCPSCMEQNIRISVNTKTQKVSVQCGACSMQWEGPRELTEETGPRLAELLKVSRNYGQWSVRWDMLSKRTENVFSTLNRSGYSRKTKKIIRSESSKVAPLCPKCRSPMRLNKPHKGQKWNAFWGCTKYRTTGCQGSIRA